MASLLLSAPLRLVVTALVIVFTLAAIRVQGAWNDAPAGFNIPNIPVGQIVPLNTSSTDQTKAGPLILEGSLTIQGGPGSRLEVGTGTSQICWNNICLNDWVDAGGANFVKLNTSSGAPLDIGFAYSNPVSAGTNGYVLQAWADSGSSHSALEGWSSSSTSGESAGVVGEAIVSSADHYGIFAAAPGSNAWAGIFSGHVRIEGNSAGNLSDLIIGDITTAPVTAARNNATAEVCLNGVCRANWTPLGTSLWSLAGSSVWPSSNAKSVSIGGSTSGAPFRLTSVPAQNAVDLAVSGGTRYGPTVIGTPTENVPFAATCGDGICNGDENDTFGSVTFCPADCDITPPGNVTNVRQVGLTCGVPPQITFAWTMPPDQDVSGTTVRRTWTAPPTGPVGGIAVPFSAPSCDLAQRTCQYVVFPHNSLNTFVGFYAYDGGPNYASGVVVGPIAPPCS